MPKRLASKDIGVPAGGIYPPLTIFMCGILLYTAEKSSVLKH
jgi:hypothetical protein